MISTTASFAPIGFREPAREQEAAGEEMFPVKFETGQVLEQFAVRHRTNSATRYPNHCHYNPPARRSQQAL
jgi:hypothetical protein